MTINPTFDLNNDSFITTSTEIKSMLRKHFILAIYNNAPCCLFTDESKVGIDAVLKPPQTDNKLHTIKFVFKKITTFNKIRPTKLDYLAIISNN